MAVVWRSLVLRAQIGLVVTMIICSGNRSMAGTIESPSTTGPTSHTPTTETTVSTTAAHEVCEETGTPANGTINYSDGPHVVNTTATYTCDPGYELEGIEARTCTENGTWSDTAPQCQLIVCEETGTPANGTINYSDGPHVVNTTATYTCDPGYELAGIEARTCTENGTWSDTAPQCQLIVCEETGTPANGTINYSDGPHVVNTTATYTCDPGYELEGIEARTCTENGTWSDTAPQCQLIVCEETGTPANGTINYSDGPHVVNTTATYICDPGYELEGIEARTCTENGTWSDTAPQCQLIVCEETGTPANGTINYSDGPHVVNTTATYTCDPGYELAGIEARTCTENGTWSDTAPQCQLIVCNEIGTPANGNISYSNTSRVVNTTVKYTCDLGYELDGTNGTKTRTCTQNGTWSDTAPQCQLKVHEYDGKCIESGPDGQCSTVNATCLIDGAVYRCRCTVKDYHYQDIDIDSCLKRPVAPKPVTLSTDLITTNSFLVGWTASDAKQKGYLVVVDWKSSQDNTLQTYNTTWQQNHNFNNFEDMASGTEYTFSLYLEKESVRTILLDTSSFYTKPEPVQTMRFEIVWEKNFTVVWDNDPARPCKNYTIALDTDNCLTIPRTNDTSQNYTFTNLTGGTGYVVGITAEVPGQSSEPLKNTSYTKPKPVTNVIVKQVLSNNMTLQLTTDPEAQKGGYKIYVTPNISDSIKNPITSTHETVMIGGLEAGREYTFTVYTYYQNQESERYLTLSAYTQPLPPDNLTVQDVLEESLQLHWSLPESNSFDKYILEYRTVDSEDVNVSCQFNKTLAMPYYVQNLTSGTGYIFNLFTVINSVSSETPATVSAFTRPEGPEMPTFKQRSETSIVIEFPSNANNYSGYQINEEVYKRGNDTITITDLDPGRNYTFTIFTVANYTVSSLNNTTFDSFTRPTHPTTANFPVGDLHETSLTVTWDAVTNGTVDGYLVYLSNDNRNMSCNGSSEITTATFSNLTTGTPYTANIYSYWRGVLSDDSLEETIYTRPTAPRGHISNVTESNLTLALDEPEVWWPNYTIKVTTANNVNPLTINVSKEEFPYEIDALTAGTNYTVEVYSMVDVIVGENALILSSYTKPEAVRPDTITVNQSLTNSSVLAIMWAQPTNGSVDWYEIQYVCTSPNDPPNMEPNYTNRSNTTTSTVSGLDPGTVCTVNITSHIGIQHGTPTQKVIDWSTNENAPDKVQGMNVEIGARNLTVTWNSPLVPNGVIRKYRLDVLDLKENCIISQTIYNCSNCSESSNPQCGDNVTSQVSKLPLCDSASETKLYREAKSHYEHSVPDLHPYRNYTVDITPFTRCYGTTMPVSKQSKQAAPTGEPKNVTQSGTTNNTLSLTWYPPLEDKQNGIITEYTVYIKYNNRTCYGEPEGNEVKKQITVNSTFGETSNNVTIPDLYLFWSYFIAVSASTVVGEGNITDEVHMMTNQSPPDVIRSPPSKLNTCSSSIDLKWEEPCNVNGIITKYQIHVFSSDDNTTVNVSETQTNETRYTIGDLKPYHNYTVSVAAINTDNETGPALNTTEALLTNTGVPFKPTNITPSAKSATSLKIQWDQPSLYTGITMYNVTARDVHSSMEFNVLTGWDFNRSEVVVDRLDEYWFYTVTVTAITEAGCNTSVVSNLTRTWEAGLWSERKVNVPFCNQSSPANTWDKMDNRNICLSQDKVQNAKNAPGSVVNLTLTTEMNVISPRSIYVVWEKPKIRDLNGILKSYFVKYTSDTQGTDVTKGIHVDTYNLTIMNIKPGPYNVMVFAATSAGNGSIVEKHIDVPPGAPIRKPENASVPLMKESSAVDVDDDETQIAIDLPTDFLCDDSNGQPMQYGLIVAAADHAIDEQFVGSKADFDANIKSNYKNWFEIRDMDKPTAYITTPEDWKPPCLNRRKRDVTIMPKPFTIGEDGECSGIPTDQNCNGQLKPATSYRIKSYVCTEGGCSETLYSAPIKTSSNQKDSALQGANTVIIVLAFLSGVGISLVAFGVVIYLKRRRVVCFAEREENDTHGVSETIPGTEMVTKTSANKILRSTSEEESNPYDVIGNHQDEDRSAYYNIDRKPYDVLERSNERSHEYCTLGQDGEHAKTNGKMYENLRISPLYR